MQLPISPGSRVYTRKISVFVHPLIESAKTKRGSIFDIPNEPLAVYPFNLVARIPFLSFFPP